MKTTSMRCGMAVGVVGMAMTLAAPAAAQQMQAPGLYEEAEAVNYGATVTFSPVHLIYPIFKAMGEFRVQDNFGLGALVGIGEINKHRYLAFGAQAIWYPQNNFNRGVQLGSQLQFERAHAEVLGSLVTHQVDSVAFGGFLGYKAVADFGLTLVAQGGIQYGMVTVTESVGSYTGTGGASGLDLLITLNLGWSF
jgi:hypothetical protein